MNKEYLYSEYIVNKKTMKQIAQVNGTCPATVYKLLRSFNIPTRSRAEHKRWNKGLSNEQTNL